MIVRDELSSAIPEINPKKSTIEDFAGLPGTSLHSSADSNFFSLAGARRWNPILSN